jgi:hypothetical protein
MRALAVLLSTAVTAACGTDAPRETPSAPERSGSPADGAPVPTPPREVAPWRPPTPTHLLVHQVSRDPGRDAITRIDLATNRIATTVGAAHPVEAPVPSTADGVTWIAGDVAGTSPAVIRAGADGPLQRIALPAAPRALLDCGDVAVVSTGEALGYVRFSQPRAGFHVLAARALDPYRETLLQRRGARAVAIESSDRGGTTVTALRLTDRDPAIAAAWPLPARFSLEALELAGGDPRWLYFVTREDHKDAHAHALGRLDLEAGRLPPGDWVDDLARNPAVIVESERGTYARHRWRFQAEQVLVGKEMTPWSSLAHLPAQRVVAVAAGERGIILVREDLTPGAKPVAHVQIRGHEARDVVVVADRLFALMSSAARDQVVEIARGTDGAWQVVRTIALPGIAGRPDERRFLR